MDLAHFRSGFDVDLVVDNPNIDYSSEETQLQMLDYFDKLQRSYLAEQVWYRKFSMRSWYQDFLMWVRVGQCSSLPDGLKGFQKVVPPEVFYVCLEEALIKVGGDRELDLLW